jgi:hypothetical protein
MKYSKFSDQYFAEKMASVREAAAFTKGAVVEAAGIVGGFCSSAIDIAGEAVGAMWDLVYEHPFVVGGGTVATFAGIGALAFALNSDVRKPFEQECGKYNKTEAGITECVDWAVERYYDILPEYRKEHGVKKMCTGYNGKTSYLYNCNSYKKADSLARGTVFGEIEGKYGVAKDARGIEKGEL